jgi:hypothetical protein
MISEASSKVKGLVNGGSICSGSGAAGEVTVCRGNTAAGTGGLAWRGIGAAGTGTVLGQ